MSFDYQRYLFAKQTLDDRAINQHVYQQLLKTLPERPLRVLEIGCGIGTMLTRLQSWQSFGARAVEYHALDANPQSTSHILQVAVPANWQVLPITADLRDFLAYSLPGGYDLLIAHAVLDLFDIPAILPGLLGLLKAGGLAWCTINFDGLSIMEPEISPEFDKHLWACYHRTMDERVTDGQPSGDSRAGRHLFHQFQAVGAQVLALGASDWVVLPQAGAYPAQEGYFLQCILDTIGNALQSHPEVDAAQLADWLAQRRAQLEQGELLYIAHQTDILAQKFP